MESLSKVAYKEKLLRDVLKTNHPELRLTAAMMCPIEVDASKIREKNVFLALGDRDILQEYLRRQIKDFGSSFSYCRLSLVEKRAARCLADDGNLKNLLKTTKAD